MFMRVAEVLQGRLLNVSVFQESVAYPIGINTFPMYRVSCALGVLERLKLYDQIFATVNVLLKAKGLQLKAATVLDLTLFFTQPFEA